MRSDKGGENVNVSTYMLSHAHRGRGRGSMITGGEIIKHLLRVFSYDDTMAI